MWGVDAEPLAEGDQSGIPVGDHPQPVASRAELCQDIDHLWIEAIVLRYPKHPPHLLEKLLQLPVQPQPVVEAGVEVGPPRPGGFIRGVVSIVHWGRLAVFGPQCLYRAPYLCMVDLVAQPGTDSAVNGGRRGVGGEQGPLGIQEDDVVATH